MVKQECEREAAARKVENLRGHVTVKHVDHVDGKVSLKPGDVAGCSVHDLQDFRVGENLVQDGQVVPERKGVDKVVLLFGGDLK